jgi:hypothetical protein
MTSYNELLSQNHLLCSTCQRIPAEFFVPPTEEDFGWEEGETQVLDLDDLLKTVPTPTNQQPIREYPYQVLQEVNGSSDDFGSDKADIDREQAGVNRGNIDVSGGQANTDIEQVDIGTEQVGHQQITKQDARQGRSPVGNSRTVSEASRPNSFSHFSPKADHFNPISHYRYRSLTHHDNFGALRSADQSGCPFCHIIIKAVRGSTRFQKGYDSPITPSLIHYMNDGIKGGPRCRRSHSSERRTSDSDDQKGPLVLIVRYVSHLEKRNWREIDGGDASLAIRIGNLAVSTDHAGNVDPISNEAIGAEFDWYDGDEINVIQLWYLPFHGNHSWFISKANSSARGSVLLRSANENRAP